MSSSSPSPYEGERIGVGGGGGEKEMQVKQPYNSRSGRPPTIKPIQTKPKKLTWREATMNRLCCRDRPPKKAKPVFPIRLDLPTEEMLTQPFISKMLIMMRYYFQTMKGKCSRCLSTIISSETRKDQGIQKTPSNSYSSAGSWNNTSSFASPLKSTTNTQLGSLDPLIRSSNKVINAKYEWYNFIFLCGYEQFSKLANFYFLIIFVLAMIGNYTPAFQSPIPATGTLLSISVVVIFAMVFEGWYDYLRHVQDRRVNKRNADKLNFHTKKWEKCAWENLYPGDVVKVYTDEEFPADLLFLWSPESSGKCYVETAALDGETNLKLRFVPAGLHKVFPTPEDCSKIRGHIVYDSPNPFLTFTGSLVLEDVEGSSPRAFPLSFASILLRASILKNTSYVVGLVIYAGPETKSVQSTKKVKQKISKVMKLVTQVMTSVLIVGLIMVLVSALYYTFFAKPEEDIWYLQATGLNGSGYSLPPFWSNFFTFVILYSNIIPIALILCITITNVWQAMLINWDKEIYYEPRDQPAKCQTLELVQEIGQVSYIFSDKTGTLTRNEMKVVGCAVGTKIHGVGCEIPGQKISCDSDIDVIFGLAVEVMKTSLPEAQNLREFFAMMSVCHTVLVDKNRKGELTYNAEGPDEQALVSAAAAVGFKLANTDQGKHVVEMLYPPFSHIQKDNNGFPKLSENNLYTYEILAMNPFNSTRKRMSIVVRCPNGKIAVFCKGADSIMFQRLKKNDSTFTPEEISKIGKHLDDFANEGLRTLVFAKSYLEESFFKEWHLRYHEASNLTGDDRTIKLMEIAEHVECELDLIGASAIEDRLQEGVPETLVCLRDAGIKTWVLTGDKVETAVNIGFSAQLLSKEMKIIQITSANKEDNLATLQELNSLFTIENLKKDSAMRRLGQKTRAENDLLSLHKNGEADPYGVIKGVRRQLLSAGHITHDILENAFMHVRLPRLSFRSHGSRDMTGSNDSSDDLLAGGAGGGSGRERRSSRSRSLGRSFWESIKDPIARVRHNFSGATTPTRKLSSPRSSYAEDLTHVNDGTINDPARTSNLSSAEQSPKLAPVITVPVPEEDLAVLELLNKVEWKAKDDMTSTRRVETMERRLLRQMSNESVNDSNDDAKTLSEASDDGGSAGAGKRRKSDLMLALEQLQASAPPPPPTTTTTETASSLENKNLLSSSQENEITNTTSSSPPVTISIPVQERPEVDEDDTFMQDLKTKTSELEDIMENIEASNLALVISGDALQGLLQNENGDRETEKILLSFAKICSVVIACRVSPKQKSLLVRMVRKGVKIRGKEPVTMAIGDGSNDVAMIQESRVGVGIQGHEGSQAVNAADFSISQFRYLQRLLLVHGRWNYRRMSMIVLYVFYSNVMFVLCSFWYNFYVNGSGTSLFSVLLLTLFSYPVNIPIIAVGMFNKDISAKTALAFPAIYVSGRANLNLGSFKIMEYILKALMHTALICGILISAIRKVNSSIDINVLGTTIFFSVVNTSLFRACFEVYTWTIYTGIMIAAGFLCFPVLEPGLYQEKSISTLYESTVLYSAWYAPFAWSAMVVTTACCIAVDIIGTSIRRFYFPTYLDIVTELDHGFEDGKEKAEKMLTFRRMLGSLGKPLHLPKKAVGELLDTARFAKFVPKHRSAFAYDMPAIFARSKRHESDRSNKTLRGGSTTVKIARNLSYVDEEKEDQVLQQTPSLSSMKIDQKNVDDADVVAAAALRLQIAKENFDLSPSTSPEPQVIDPFSEYNIEEPSIIVKEGKREKNTTLQQNVVMLNEKPNTLDDDDSKKESNIMIPFISRSRSNSKERGRTKSI